MEGIHKKKRKKSIVLSALTVIISLIFLVSTGVMYGSSNSPEGIDINHLNRGKEKNTVITTGVLDRFEGDKAVILMEELNEEIIVQKNNLPAGATVDMWFQIKMKQEAFEIIAVDLNKTVGEGRRIEKLMKVLREKRLE